MAHLYGGFISTQAVEARFARWNRGEKGGVVGILYICAFLLEVGQSLAGALDGSLPPYVAVGVSAQQNDLKTSNVAES